MAACKSMQEYKWSLPREIDDVARLLSRPSVWRLVVGPDMRAERLTKPIEKKVDGQTELVNHMPQLSGMTSSPKNPPAETLNKSRLGMGLRKSLLTGKQELSKGDPTVDIIQAS
eukprot:1145789-Pelagomonas_calceolata.AAC.2